MPNGNLPAAGYLGNGQRTTSEFQGGIDELLGYVRSLKAEIDVLSSQVLREGAVRGVGSGGSDLVTNAAANARFLPSSFVNVWSGNQSSVPDADLSDGGPGWYRVRADLSDPTIGTAYFMIYHDPDIGNAVNAGSSYQRYLDTGGIVRWWHCFSSGNISVRRSDLNTGSGLYTVRNEPLLSIDKLMAEGA